MTTTGQFNTKNPTIKRILKEASELSTSPPPHIHAAPLESNIFEWHFTLRGPPAPSSFEAGVYHGRIVLPASYPLRPPSFRFMTPSGRFEVNREICLSISGHHEETWQPAWGIRTALVALRSFMDTDAKGQVGGVDTTDTVRKRFAADSRGWTCQTCTRSNLQIMETAEAEATSNAQGDRASTSGSAAAAPSIAAMDIVPPELRLAYKDEMIERRDTAPTSPPSTSLSANQSTASSSSLTSASARLSPTSATASASTAGRQIDSAGSPRAATPARTTPANGAKRSTSERADRQLQQQQAPPSSRFIDVAIVGLGAALALMLIRKLVTLLL